ncbi:hypothetical protein NQ314_014506 [Rhamnusium bicolor]|uniref:Elongation of very long chain fatty acids protein n=1 Tax=Rhamnusium bicolor TaxID=1586634 RepID=A0AAV8X342_9CUCU|nr:hypothetical protein NQ314_014506 [Rhamnusium bicolor]
MENRKPLQLKWTLVIYNFLQVVFSTWLFYQVGMGGWLTGEYSYRCQPVDYSDKPSTKRMVHASWWYFFSKFTEFMDTVLLICKSSLQIFFVLRKKNDHISTLHVIHHGVMPMSVWFGVKYTPVMDDSAQFVGIMIHAFQLLFIDCNYPRAFVWWIGMHAVMFFFLFKEFYNDTYNKKKRAAEAKALQKQNGYVQNGYVKNGLVQNGDIKPNSTVNQSSATTVTKISDYYVNGSNDIHHRIKSK